MTTAAGFRFHLSPVRTRHQTSGQSVTTKLEFTVVVNGCQLREALCLHWDSRQCLHYNDSSGSIVRY